jgi:hypothetical protein
MRLSKAALLLLMALVMTVFGMPAGVALAVGPPWAMDQQPVPYCVNPAGIPLGSNGPIMSGADLAAKVQAAFATWTAVPGANISLTYTGFCDNSPLDLNDGVNTIGFGKLHNDSLGADIGETREPRQTKTRMLEADIVIDTRYAQSFDNMSQYLNVALANLLLHETGHFLGLEHTKEPCSIMRPFIDDVIGGLCDYDRDTLRALYPAS